MGINAKKDVENSVLDLVSWGKSLQIPAAKRFSPKRYYYTEIKLRMLECPSIIRMITIKNKLLN